MELVFCIRFSWLQLVYNNYNFTFILCECYNFKNDISYFVSKGWTLWKGTLFYLVFYFCVSIIALYSLLTLAGILGHGSNRVITGTYLNESKL